MATARVASRRTRSVNLHSPCVHPPSQHSCGDSHGAPVGRPSTQPAATHQSCVMQWPWTEGCGRCAGEVCKTAASTLHHRLQPRDVIWHRPCQVQVQGQVSSEGNPARLACSLCSPAYVVAVAGGVRQMVGSAGSPAAVIVKRSILFWAPSHEAISPSTLKIQHLPSSMVAPLDPVAVDPQPHRQRVSGHTLVRLQVARLRGARVVYPTRQRCQVPRCPRCPRGGWVLRLFTWDSACPEATDRPPIATKATIAATASTDERA